MVTIRLSRQGTNKLPFYRVVVTDSRSKRDGRFLENIGNWDPRTGKGEGTFQLDTARYKHWLSVGAKPSAVVGKLVRDLNRKQASAPAAGTQK